MKSPFHLHRVKTLEQLQADREHPEFQLKRSLGPLQLTFLGIGAIVGAGMFSSIGTAAAGGGDHVGAGPAIVISFILVAIACSFAALCYAEFASMVPVAGSAYTYAYATLGELVAWLIGWDLILEYAIGNVAVAISWSAYFQELLRGLQWELPHWLGTDFRSATQAWRHVANLPADLTAFSLPMAHSGQDLLDALKHLGSVNTTLLRDAHGFVDAPRLAGIPLVFNLPAFLIVAAITWVLVIGIRETVRFNSTMVVLKLAVIVFFLGLGAFYVEPEHWTPFAPHGWAGIGSAAAVIFFAYIGFDAVSTAAEEARNPQRDMPVGIIASLVVCTVIYIAVAVVLTGLADSKTLGNAEPLAAVFAGRGMQWTAGVISMGALLATTSVLVAFQVGQPRIFFSMARDGLLPAWAAKVHPRYRTPHATTILTGVFVGVVAAVTNINEMVELTNIGTLFAFILVAIGIIVLRRTDPQRERPFRVPWVPWVPLGAVVTCGGLMLLQTKVTWLRFLGWMVVGLVIYLAYGRFNSRLAKPR